MNYSTLKEWIQEKHFSNQSVKAIQSCWLKQPSCVYLFENFLRPEKCDLLKNAAIRLANWRHEMGILKEGGDFTRNCDNKAWESATNSERFYSHYILYPSKSSLISLKAEFPKEYETFQSFHSVFVFEKLFHEWIADVLELPNLNSRGVEWARYAKGSFIQRHNDLYGGQIFGLNIYLESATNETSGGRLCFENEAGQSVKISCQLNSATLLPLREGCWHFVEEWKNTSDGRLTAAIAFTDSNYSEQQIS